MARYANWQSDEAQTFLILWVRLPLAPLKHGNTLRRLGIGKPQCRNPPAFGLWRFASVPAGITRAKRNGGVPAAYVIETDGDRGSTPGVNFPTSITGRHAVGGD